MSHTFQSRNHVTFISSTGLDDWVEIRDFNGGAVNFPIEDLIEFLADKIRDQKISKLESASDYEIVGIEDE